MWHCCRSSVVEHPLGKGEVVSSILTGSTRNQHENRYSSNAPAADLHRATGCGTMQQHTSSSDKQNSILFVFSNQRCWSQPATQVHIIRLSGAHSLLLGIDRGDRQAGSELAGQPKRVQQRLETGSAWQIYTRAPETQRVKTGPGPHIVRVATLRKDGSVDQEFGGAKTGRAVTPVAVLIGRQVLTCGVRSRRRIASPALNASSAAISHTPFATDCGPCVLMLST